MEVGNIVYSHVVQKGYVKAAGQEVYREDYPLLYQFARENELLLSEAEWANGRQGMYSLGDEHMTFRMPDLRSEFLRALDDGRGLDTGRTLGSIQGDAIRNIKGHVDGYMGLQAQSSTNRGAFEIANYSDGNAPLGIAQSYHSLLMDISRVVPTAPENRPKNIALIAQIKY